MVQFNRQGIQATDPKAAWQNVRRHRGSTGVDGQSIERFEAREAIYLEELSAALSGGTYRPEAIRPVEIPKGDGKTRPLGIPTVKDRIVQGAVKRVIEPIFKQKFLPMSYGSRPERGSKDAAGNGYPAQGRIPPCGGY